jgi:hypothetical protein
MINKFNTIKTSSKILMFTRFLFQSENLLFWLCIVDFLGNYLFLILYSMLEMTEAIDLKLLERLHALGENDQELSVSQIILFTSNYRF